MDKQNAANYLIGFTDRLRRATPGWHEPDVALATLENALRSRGHSAQYEGIGVKNSRHDEIIESGYLRVDEVFVPIQIVATMRHFKIVAEDVLIQ